MNTPHPDTAIAMCREQEAKIERLEAVNAELLEALKGIFGLVESGDLVRDISKDHESDWALRQLPFIAKLKAAEQAIASAEEEP